MRFFQKCFAGAFGSLIVAIMLAFGSVSDANAETLAFKDYTCTTCVAYALCITGYGYNLLEQGNYASAESHLSDAMDYCIANQLYHESGEDYRIENMIYYSILQYITSHHLAAAEVLYDVLNNNSVENISQDATATFANIKRNALDLCYSSGDISDPMCDPDYQCHNQYGDQYILSIPTSQEYMVEQWMNPPLDLLVCQTCPQDSDGAQGYFNASEHTYSWGESSCYIPTATKQTDSTGIYAYSTDCNYKPTINEILIHGYF